MPRRDKPVADSERKELLDLIEELHGFLRHGTFDAVRGEGSAYRRGLEVLARYGRAATTSSTKRGSDS